MYILIYYAYICAHVYITHRVHLVLFICTCPAYAGEFIPGGDGHWLPVAFHLEVGLYGIVPDHTGTSVTDVII